MNDPPSQRRIRIIGIDPGSRVTGYGVVDAFPTRVAHVASGCVHARAGDLAGRLHQIFTALGGVVEALAPHEFAVEQVFVHRNVVSALKLGHARGAALLAAASREIPVHEYSPNQVKQAVTGRGHASKEQIQHMVRVLLSLRETPPSDAADALAVAICHAHLRETARRVARAAGAAT